MTRFSKRTQQLLKLALAEDLGKGDITSRLLIPRSARADAVVLSRGPGIFCGEPVARRIFSLADSHLQCNFHFHDGEPYTRGQALFEISGPLRSILAAERTALNFLQRLCGIASITHELVKRAKPLGVEILDTRKTTPLWRELEKYAVRSGGGKNHRMGLYDALFIKENHRRCADWKRLGRYRGKFEIEVRNQEELRHALELEPRVILFDNFQPAELTRAVSFVRAKKGKKIILEASGGIGLHNVAAFARTGVDWISIGALTHSVPASDLSLLILD